MQDSQRHCSDTSPLSAQTAAKC